jgi:hypothetical protein
LSTTSTVVPSSPVTAMVAPPSGSPVSLSVTSTSREPTERVPVKTTSAVSPDTTVTVWPAAVS